MSWAQPRACMQQQQQHACAEDGGQGPTSSYSHRCWMMTTTTTWMANGRGIRGQGTDTQRLQQRGSAAQNAEGAEGRRRGNSSSSKMKRATEKPNAAAGGSKDTERVRSDC